MSFYRNAAFFIKGNREFTRSGYEKASKKFNVNEMVNINLSGKRVIVTGANSGIGLICSQALAAKGAEVHMVCRNKERAEEARLKVVASTNNNNVRAHIVDLSKLKDVSQFCSSYVSEFQSLDILVNNAGCMVNERKLNDDGLEVNFATNSLSVYIITNLLIPTLKKSSDPRVILVSSGGMLTQKLNAKDPSLVHDPIANSAFDGTMVYAQNKRQQVVMTKMWAKTFPEIFFAAMHPGWADTPAVALSMPSFYEKMKTKLRSAEQGADTAIWLATTSQRSKLSSGQFYFDRDVAACHLPLALTKSSTEDEENFMEEMGKLAQPFLQN